MSLFSLIVQNRAMAVKHQFKPIQIFRQAIKGRRVDHRIKSHDLNSIRAICKSGIKGSDGSPMTAFNEIVADETSFQAHSFAYDIRTLQMGTRFKAIAKIYERKLTV